MYTVEEALKKLKQYGITDNAEVVRRWLRSGKLKGVKPEKKRDGWRIAKEDLDAFIAERVPAVENALNATKVASEEKAICKEGNTTKVVNEQIEQLQEKIERLREENRQQAQEIARLAKKCLKKPKGLKKRVSLLESIIMERYDVVSRAVKIYKQDERRSDYLKDYFEGKVKQAESEFIFLESVIKSMKIQKEEYMYTSDFEERGIKIMGRAD